MVKDESIVVFPQHERKHETTIEGKIRNIVDASPSLKAALKYIGGEFPNLTMGELTPIIRSIAAERQEEGRRAEQEIAALEEIIPMMKEAEEITGRENITFEEVLTVLAERGNEKAAAYLEYLTRPEARFWEFVTDKAIESDPYWVKEGKYIKTLEGAVHETPEALALAYVKNHMDQILEDLPTNLKEWLVQKHVEDLVQEELDRLVEKGEIEIVRTEGGENIYQKKK